MCDFRVDDFDKTGSSSLMPALIITLGAQSVSLSPGQTNASST
jgi:hypothetical protein